MLYDLIGIESTSTTLIWIFLGIALLFVIPAAAIVMIVRYVAKAAATRRASAARAPVTEFKFDVFLSYSSTDRPQAATLAEKLELAGLKLFFAERTLEAGTPFTEEIRKALHDSRETWLLASPASIASTWVATEWGTAWALDRKIVPVLLNLTSESLPDRLRMLHAVAYAAIDAEVSKARARLVAAPKEA